MNGISATWLDLDSGHRHPDLRPVRPAAHPPVHVLPAALAVAELMRSSGQQFLDAYAVGYEVAARVNVASHIRPEMHVHGTHPVIGAAVAAARLKGFDVPHMMEAINVAASLTLATTMKTALQGATVRNVYSGAGAANGLLAADLVASGFTGEQDGIGTVFGSVSGDAFDPGACTRGLGSRFELVHGYYKVHACCRWCHPTLDALDRFLAARSMPAEQINRIDVQTFGYAAWLADQAPESELGAKFSLPHAIASRLVLGTSTEEAFVEQAVNRPEIRALRQRIFVTENPAFTAEVPTHKRTAITIALRDGTHLHLENDGSEGDPDRPLNHEVLEQKFLRLASKALSPDRAEAALKSLQQLDSTATADLISHLQ